MSKYYLYGFSNGGGESPQFVEPVFIRNGNLFVQSCTDKDNPDVITDFIVFIDEIEIFENSAGEYVGLGDNKLFAIRDVGDRIIPGDRSYVSKYLIQNLNVYIDFPYFFFDVCELTTHWRPELKLLSPPKNRLECSILSNSIERFCYSDYSGWKKSTKESSLIPTHSNKRKSKYQKEWLCIIDRENEKKSSVFSRWLQFAELDSPKIATRSSWKEIDNTYIFLSGSKQTPSGTDLQAILQSVAILINDRENVSKVTEQAKNPLADLNLFIEALVSSQEKKIKRRIEFSTTNNSSVDEARQVSNMSKFLGNTCESLLVGKLSIIELTMLVYFVEVLLKKISLMLSEKN